MLPRTPMPAVVEHAEVQAQAQFPSRSLEVEAWIVTAQAGAEAGWKWKALYVSKDSVYNETHTINTNKTTWNERIKAWTSE